MKRTLYAAAALFFGANLACAGTGALASLKAAGPATFSGSVSAGVDGASVESSNLGVPTVTPGAPVTSDFANFWEKLKDGTIDDVCKAAQLKLNENVRLGSVPGVGGGVGRYLLRAPSQKLALVDEVDVNLSATLGNDILQLPAVQGLGVSLSGRLEGRSQVVRPLDSDKYCRELGTLVKLYDLKTAIPATAGRISAMEIGEIWKLPLSLRFSFGATLGTTFNELVSVSVSAGESKERRPSVTLYRMDENRLRLRVRLDRVTVQSAGASVSGVQFPLSDLGLWNADNVLAGFVNRTWAGEVNKFLAAQLSFGYSRNFGKKLLVEFILDPKDARQMAALEKFMRSDFSILKRFIELGLHFNHFAENDETAGGLGEITDAAGQAARGVGEKPSFAGSDIYHGHSNNLHMRLPFVHAQDVSWSASYNRYQSTDRQGETLHVQQRTRNSDGRSVNLPFLGSQVKYNSQKTVYVVNKEGLDGKTSMPALMYQQNEGFLRQGDGTARDMLETANGVLRYVGVNGGAANEGNTLPSAEIFPDTGGFFKHYDTAVMNFKLLINERGLQEILLAPAQAVMKAYLNMMRRFVPGIVDKVMGLFYIGEEGRVRYDSREAARRVGGTSADYANPVKPVDVVKKLALGAEEFLRGLAGARGAAGWKAQAEKLAEIAAGSSDSGLSYEDFLQVVVQVVDPLNVSAEVYVHTDKQVEGEEDVTRNYQFFNGRDNSFDAGIAEVNQMHARFADPAVLTD